MCDHSAIHLQKIFSLRSIAALAAFLWLPPQTAVVLHAVPRALTCASSCTGPLVLAYGIGLVLGWPQGVTPAIWSLYMQDRGASLPLIGLSFTAFALTAAGLAPWAGRIADRYGRWQPLLVGLVLAGGVYCVYSLRLPPEGIIGLALVEGVGLAVARVATDGFLADHIPQGLQGHIHALFSAAGTAGSLAGATVAGWLYTIAPGMPLLAMGVLYLLVAVLLLVVPAIRQRCRAVSMGQAL